MPKAISKSSNKKANKIVESDEESVDDKLVESDVISTVTDTASEASEEVVDEDIEETVSSEDNEEPYIETESEEEKDLKEGDPKEEEDCDYELEDSIAPPSTVRKERTERSTRPVLTKYERVRVLGTRAKQIAVGAKVNVSGIEDKTPLEIAELELKHGLIPFIIIREFPDNTFEKWKLSELVPKTNE